MTCNTDIIAEFNEEGSGAIGIAITGLADEALTPNSFSWTLTDIDGVVINSRLDVSETPAAITGILLQGDDLADVHASDIRLITIKGTYNSTLFGVAKTNVPYTEEKRIRICKEINIPNPPTP